MDTTTRKRTLAPILVALLAVTAGCSFLGGQAPTASPPVSTDAEAPAQSTARTATATTGVTAVPPTDSTGTPTDAPWEGVGVQGTGNLSVDADRVFDRVQRLHGVDVDPPIVTVDSLGSGERPVLDSRFYEAFGVTGTATIAGRFGGGSSVFLNEDVEAQERVLAHEFAHYVHSKAGWWPNRGRNLSVDETVAVEGVIEGSAVFASDAYAAASESVEINGSRETRLDYEQGDEAFKVLVSKYLVGERYVDTLAADPSDLEPLLTDPPTTTERLLHPTRNVSVGDLSVTADESANWTTEPGHYGSNADRRGELRLREILRLELDRAMADAAANGWDNDRSLTFTSTGEERRAAAAWTLRFEYATETDEFAAAFDRFAERRSANSSLAFATERVAPETVAVFAGNETFVDGAVATGGNESVHIAAPGTNGTASTQGARPLAAD